VRIGELWAVIIQECALVQSEATLAALWLELIKVPSVVDQGTFLNKFQLPMVR